MGSITRYTLLTASRDWLFFGLIFLSLVAISISMFLGGTALVEQDQMSTVYMAGSVRLILVVGLIVFVCFHVRRGFETKEIDVTLSRPISRPAFVLSYWAGFVILTVLISLPIFIVIGVVTHSMQTHTSWFATAYWALSVLLEASMMVAFALVASLILRSAVASVLSSFAFYIAARMMGFFTAAFKMPLATGDSLLIWKIMKHVLEGISVVFPRLDLFGKTGWLVYGIEGADNLWLIQSVLYIPILLAMATTDFCRKQF